MRRVKPWLAHYDSDVRPSLAPYPDKTLLDYLTQLARDHGDKPALLFKGALGVLRAARGRERRLRRGARRRSACGQGDRVALVLPNCPQFFVARVRRLEGRRRSSCR